MNWRKRLAEIVARMAEIKGETSEIEAIEAPTAEDATRAEALLTEWDTLEAERVEAAAKVEKLDAIRAAALDPINVEPAFSVPNVNIRKDPFENVEEAVRLPRDGDEVRKRAVAAIESGMRIRGVSDEHRENAIRTIEEVDGAAAYALAHGSPAYMSAFRKFVNKRGVNVRYSDEEMAALDTAEYVRTALNITTGNSGAFSLPTLFDDTLIHTGTAAINPIRSIARVESGTQNVWHGVSSGNVTTYWHAEASALTDGAPTLASPIVTAGMLTAFVPLSFEFYEDSSLVAQLPGLIAESMAFKESSAFVNGSGTNQPLGVITAISATAGSTVTATTRGASSFTSASVQDIWNVVNAVEPRYEDTASWIGNKKTFNITRQMSPSGAGSSFWGTLADPVTNRQPLAGSPAYNSSDVVSTQTTGTIILVLGDFKQYLVYDRIGMQVEWIQNVVDGSGLPTAQRALVVHKRVGGNVTDVNAFRFLLN